ncbi:MAG TPA: hypothetical protein VD790_07470 [Thermoleophilaceae bacterium]|nr:hypothetical protein [Thermoleophilaceae bacterium]
MGPRRACILVLIAATLAGCGSDDNGETAETSGTDSAAAIGQDAEAKADAREFTTYAEACFVDQLDYSACMEPDGAQAEAPTAEMESADASTYTVVATSDSGNEFRVTKAKSGELVRECTTAGEGGCPADGAW